MTDLVAALLFALVWPLFAVLCAYTYFSER